MSVTSFLKRWLVRPAARPAKAQRRRRVRLALEDLERRELLSTYYISQTGNDSNNGTSQLTPWRTIAKVNQSVFHSGDSILFEGNGTFTGNLLLSGEAIPNTPATVQNIDEAPTSRVIIGSYGSGRATIYAATGTALTIENTQNFTIENLIFRGFGVEAARPNNGDGILVLNETQDPNNGGQPVTLRSITINNVEAYDFGNDQAHYDGWGIRFVAGYNGNPDPSLTSYPPDSGANFQGVTVTNSALHDNGNGGLDLVDNLFSSAFVDNAHVSGVQAYHNAGVTMPYTIGTHQIGTGFGILVANASGATVDHCLTYTNGWLPTQQGGGGGIIAIGSPNVTIQYSESYGNLAPTVDIHNMPIQKDDGDGIGLDSCTYSVVQYNYTHDNAGAGIITGVIDGPESFNDTIRFNVSENDSRTQGYAGIYITSLTPSTEVYNNTIFLSPPTSNLAAAAVAGIVDTGSFNTGGANDGYYGHFRNNLIETSGTETLPDGTTGPIPSVYIYQPSGNVQTTDMVFQGNDYWSTASSGPVILYYDGQTYTSLASWRAASRQEEINSLPVGREQDPQLTDPGHGGTIGSVYALSGLSAYRLKSTSPLTGAGVHLLEDFLVDPGARDYFGNAVPKYSIGADSAGAAFLVVSTRFPSPVTAGTPGSLTVTLEDHYGRVATDYVGVVHFSSSDRQAGLPANYTFTAADAGVHTFSVTLKTAGTQSISITDRNDSVLFGQQTGITVTPAATAKLVVSGFPASTAAGVPHTFTATAQDRYGNTTPAYTGTVYFSSSDSQAFLPGAYAFTSGDNGTHTFSATLNTAGTQSLKATDTVTASIAGTESGIVVAGAGPNSSGGNGGGTPAMLLTSGADSTPLASSAAPATVPVTDPTSLPSADPAPDQGAPAVAVDPASGTLTASAAADVPDDLSADALLA